MKMIKHVSEGIIYLKNPNYNFLNLRHYKYLTIEDLFVEQVIYRKEEDDCMITKTKLFWSIHMEISILKMLFRNKIAFRTKNECLAQELVDM